MINLEAWLLHRRNELRKQVEGAPSVEVQIFLEGQRALLVEIGALFIAGGSDAETPVEAVDEGSQSGC